MSGVVAIPRPPSSTILRASLVAVLCTLAGLPAQNTLSREFEAAFLARREVELDAAWRAADDRRREDCLLPLHRALGLRPNDVLNGERARLLCRATAVLRGLPYGKDANGELTWPDARAFRDFGFRFNLWLIGLPEVVDPAKSQLDVDRIAALFRGRLPALGRVEGPLEPLGPGRIHLTARGVFGVEKPKEIELGMTVIGPDGEVCGKARRGDSRDPEGWRVFDLHEAFDVGLRGAGRYEGAAELFCDGRAPTAVDPPVGVRFAVRPGLHQEFWALMERRRLLQERPAGEPGDPYDLARLDVALRELHRVVVLGKEYCFHPWALEALDEARALSAALLAGEVPPLPERGDRVAGLPVQAPIPAAPARMLWGKAVDGARRATIWFGPGGWGPSWAVDGLGLDTASFQADGEVHVFVGEDLGGGYLDSLRRRLGAAFGVPDDGLRVVGVQDGAVKARLALGSLGGTRCTLVQVGTEDDGLAHCTDAQLARVELVPALGLPLAPVLEALPARRARLPETAASHLVRGDRMQSLREAVGLVVGGK